MLATGSSGGFGAVLFLLVLAPAGSAVAPHVTMTAPYSGSVANSNAWSTYGCAKASIATPTSFSLTHGLGSAAGKASAKTCRGSFGGSQYDAGVASGASTIAIKLNVATGGTKTVVANWTITVAGHQNLSMAPCVTSNASGYSYCYEYAIVYVSAYSWLVDLKTGASAYSSSSFYQYNASYNDSYCYNGTCANYTYGTNGGFSGAFGALFSISSSTSTRHTYALYTTFYWVVEVASASYAAHFSGGASGTASLDMATGGNGAKLNSITIT